MGEWNAYTNTEKRTHLSPRELIITCPFIIKRYHSDILNVTNIQRVIATRTIEKLILLLIIAKDSCHQFSRQFLHWLTGLFLD